MYVDAAGRADQGSMSSSPNVALDDLLAVTMVSAAGSCGNLRRRGTASAGPIWPGDRGRDRWSPISRYASKIQSVTTGEMTEPFTYELDTCEPAESEGPPRQRAGRLLLRAGPTRRYWIAIVAAFAAGVAVGAAGVQKERDAAADRASRSAVSLAAVLVGVGGTDPTHEYDVSFRLRLYNAGHQPVDVTAAAIVGSGYLAPHDDAISKAVAQPQQWTALVAIAGSPDCDTRAVALRALEEPSLRVNARTANGRERHVDVSLADPYDLLTSTRNAKCETPAAASRPPRSPARRPVRAHKRASSNLTGQDRRPR
jgi:hypothetical protein